MTGEGHIPLACTPEPSSAAPIEGALEKAEVEFEHAMTVTRVRETPRTTKPYTEDSGPPCSRSARRSSATSAATMCASPWAASDLRVGRRHGRAGMEHAGAGPGEAAPGGRAVRKLANRFATGPLLHFGQGKWYPGEQLPRRALGCYWRKDGEPIWRNPQLYALESKPVGATVEAAHDSRSPSRNGSSSTPTIFSRPTRTPGTTVAGTAPASNVVVDEAKVKDPLERERLARVFEKGLESSVGYVLPVMRDFNGRGNGHSHAPALEERPVVPALGEVLPDPRRFADRLPPAARFAALGRTGDTDIIVQPDPMAPHPDLPPLDAFGERRCCGARSQPSPAIRAATPKPPRERGVEHWRRTRASGPRSALPRPHRPHRDAFEPRDGHLHVFMPPTERMEDYLDLVTALEDTAEEQGQPIFIEGYTPPGDSRVLHFSVTPDPA